MSKDLSYMENISIFEGITANEKEKMFGCFSPREYSFLPDEIIMTYQSAIERIGILMDGKAAFYCVDTEGNQSLLEQYGVNAVFGEIFLLPSSTLGYFVQAQTRCKVIFIDYQHIVKRCHNACLYHSRLVSNLFILTAKKAQSLTAHINILSQRTVRRKLIAYFEFQCRDNGKESFQLPMTYSALAEYLCVERSSMMREIKKMKEDGLLETEGRTIRLLPVAPS